MKRKESAAVEAELEEVKRAASELGLEVREEEILREVGYRARSGVCRVGDRTVVVIDRRLSGRERIEILYRAMADRDLEDLERVFLSPALRAKLTAMRPAVPSGRAAPAAPESTSSDPSAAAPEVTTATESGG